MQMNNKNIQRKGIGSGLLSVDVLIRAFIAFAVLVWIYFAGVIHSSGLHRVEEIPLLRGSISSSNVANFVSVTKNNVQMDNKDNKVNYISSNGLLHKPFGSPADNNYHTDHLVIVAGHAVVHINQLTVADKTDSAWWLLDYQQNQGFPSILSAHIKRGLSILADDPGALLLFSGGQTRKDVGPLSEAASYYYVADANGWIPALSQVSGSTAGADKQRANSEPRERIFLEEYVFVSHNPLTLIFNAELTCFTRKPAACYHQIAISNVLLCQTNFRYARDSMENLLFSMCRYREVVGSYPRHVTVVGFDFKANRFERLHRAAIGIPSTMFTYEGLDPGELFHKDTATQGEQSVVQAFTEDPYACSKTLSEKEQSRNPFHRSIPYLEACPEIHELLLWCGPGEYPNLMNLPWNSPVTARDTS